MDSNEQPHRCPQCHALVVDRRSPVCTTCRTALPKEWVMTPAQAAKTMKLDADARVLHAQEMRKIDPLSDPNVPPLVRFLDQNVSGIGF